MLATTLANNPCPSRGARARSAPSAEAAGSPRSPRWAAINSLGPSQPVAPRLKAGPQAHPHRLPHLPVQVRPRRRWPPSTCRPALPTVPIFWPRFTNSPALDINRIQLRVHHLHERRPAALGQPVTDENHLAPRVLKILRDRDPAVGHAVDRFAQRGVALRRRPVLAEMLALEKKRKLTTAPAPSGGRSGVSNSSATGRLGRMFAAKNSGQSICVVGTATGGAFCRAAKSSPHHNAATQAARTRDRRCGRPCALLT